MCRFIQLLALLAMPLLFLGCQAPQAPVPTLGQKLGIPQAFTGRRDARRNRTGNRPQREWKPPVKRLADPANLADKIPGTELPMPPAVQVAAKLKVQEDMADQKIKGLKYLGMIGCGCYDKDGELKSAFLEALQDCTPCVRLAAIAALNTTLDADECQSQSLSRKERRNEKQVSRFKKQREKCSRGRDRQANCDSCRGAGCQECVCDCSECVAESYVSNCSCGGIGCSLCARFRNRCSQNQCSQQGFGACTSCDGGGCTACGGCGSCLGKEICKRLEKMAYDQDKDGCWIEPLENIRAAAADLSARCPFFPDEPEPAVPPIEKGPDPEKKDDKKGPEPETKEEEKKKSETNGQTTYNVYQHPSRRNSYTFGDTPASSASYSGQTAQQSTMVKGVATPYQNREMMIDLEDTYLLPINSEILIQYSGGEHVYQVLASEVGRVLARPSSPLAPQLAERQMVNVGVLAQ